MPFLGLDILSILLLIKHKNKMITAAKSPLFTKINYQWRKSSQYVTSRQCRDRHSTQHKTTPIVLSLPQACDNSTSVPDPTKIHLRTSLRFQWAFGKSRTQPFRPQAVIGRYGLSFIANWCLWRDKKASDSIAG